MLCQSGGDGGCGTRSASDSDGPVGPAEPLGTERADNPPHVTAEKPPVAAGYGLLGGSEDLGQPAEGRPGVDVESLDNPSVQYINPSGSHEIHHSAWHKQAHSAKLVAED